MGLSFNGAWPYEWGREERNERKRRKHTKQIKYNKLNKKGQAMKPKHKENNNTEEKKLKTVIL